MAQPLQKQAAPGRLQGCWRPEIAEDAQLADCIALPEPQHFTDVVTSLEQEAFRGGAEFVGK